MPNYRKQSGMIAKHATSYRIQRQRASAEAQAQRKAKELAQSLKNSAEIELQELLVGKTIVSAEVVEWADLGQGRTEPKAIRLQFDGGGSSLIEQDNYSDCCMGFCDDYPYLSFHKE